MDIHPVRAARKAQRMSARQLSEASGVSMSAIYDIEQRRSVGRVDTLVSLARALRLPISDLVDVVGRSGETVWTI